MKLKNQVCSFKLAKKLESLNIKQDSLWWWCECQGGWGVFSVENKCKEEKSYAAFTVAELGDFLKDAPVQVMSVWIKGKREWSCILNTGMDDTHKIADTEANARAKMVCYLKEKNL